MFERFRQLGSARQTHLSLAAEGVFFPRPSDGKRLTSFDWTPIRYRNVIGLLKNPFYAGAYVYGKSEKRIELVDGRARKSYGHGKPPEAWEVSRSATCSWCEEGSWHEDESARNPPDRPSGGPEATKKHARYPSLARQADQAAISAQPNALIRRSLENDVGCIRIKG